ncbi:hypothetical protein IMG5_197830 [Ichthyophthirius multifiliis]|uniref:Cation efflux family protein n=1 Tax=Ichthyophthirius multifiliis TaxID=5932 RepID=G0R5C6_ICHMU|nr:hypothetical protein IMG5_197830 [Ichthyophthirius multifiliis]EGR27315.1 hypothetical protein IMG5_197830 [Ichthyophthirius multifiliis]|eukprot:XP_004024199.1 hypothetical protein IMG5_197830 [Ichthyophthirius multifiliis]
MEQNINNNDKIYLTPDLQKNKASALKALKTVCCVSFSFMCIEFIGGYLSNSLAIMTDAVHLLSDVVGFIITITAIYVSRIEANKKMTFGYHRAEIIGATFSILIIWGLIIWMFLEGIERLMNPPQIQGVPMMILSICGLLFNLILMRILEGNVQKEEQKQEELLSEIEISARSLLQKDEKQKNMSMKAAQIHILGDTIQSAGVIIGASFVYFGGEDYYIADPIITILFTIVVTFTTLPVMKESIKVLMEGQPDNINYDFLKDQLVKVQGVIDVHDLHVWSLNPGFISLSAHLTSNSPSLSLFQATKLCKQLGIVHSTIQVENYNEQNIYDFKKCAQLH